MTELRTQQSGRLEDVSPLDLLQSLGIYRRAGYVVFIHPYGQSQLWFEAGAIVDARSGALHGAAALHRIATHDCGEFRVEVTGQAHGRTIEGSGSALIFEAARRLDEGQRLWAQLPAADAVLARADGAAIHGPSEAHARVAALFDAGITLGEVLERSAIGELETLQWVAKLVEAGELRPTGAVRSPGPPTGHGLVEPVPWQLDPSQSFVPSPSYAAHEPLGHAVPRRRRWWIHASVGAALAASVTMAIVRGSADDSAVEAAASVMDGGPASVVAATMPSRELPAEPAPRELVVGAAAVVPPSHGERTTSLRAAATSVERGKGSRVPGRPHRARAEDAPVAIPEPRAEPAVAPADASSLLAEARRAYAAGQGAAAYRLAARSQKLRPSGEAAEVMTLAACQQKRTDLANDALRGVPLMRRAHVRSGCRQAHGVRLKLGRSTR